MPSFKCEDIGMDCSFQTDADNEDKLMRKIEEHASKVHNMKKMTPEMEEQIKGAIKP